MLSRPRRPSAPPRPPRLPFGAPAAAAAAMVAVLGPLAGPAPAQVAGSGTDGEPAPPPGALLPADPSPWVTGALALATLVALDGSVREVTLRSRGELADGLADGFEKLGAWRVSIPLVSATALLAGGATEGRSGLARALSALAGIAAGSFAAEGVNQLVGRVRPDREVGNLSFRPLEGHASFPSGHTALAFSIAGAVDAVTSARWLPPVAYAAAAGTGLSRLYHDRHWISDVVAGAAIGAVVSRSVAGRVQRALGAERPAGPPGSGTSSGDLLDASATGPELIAGPGMVGVRIRLR